MVRTVRGLLERGYPVLVRAMPFMHWNAQPIADPHDAATLVTLTPTTASPAGSRRGSPP